MKFLVRKIYDSLKSVSDSIKLKIWMQIVAEKLMSTMATQNTNEMLGRSAKMCTLMRKNSFLNCRSKLFYKNRIAKLC